MPKKKEIKEPNLEFKDKTELEMAIADFRLLAVNPGWQRIVNFLDGKIKYYEHQLAEGEINDIHELKTVRKLRNNAMQMRNLPDIITGQLQLSQGESINFDPYEDLTKSKN